MNMDKDARLAYRRQLLELMRGYRPAQVLISCAELGVFEALGNQARSADELARQVGVAPGALARLLNAAVALGMLEKTRAGEYRVGPAAADCLVNESPYYIGNLLRREGAFYRRWSRLAEAVRQGGRPEENASDEHDANWVRNFELALFDAARQTAPLVAEVLEPLLPERAARVIDVGGGHGAYSLALAGRFPQLQAVIFELPAAAEVAREIVGRHAPDGRVTVESGDFRVDGLGRDYDLALLFGVLVSETPDSARALLRKVGQALRPGGWAVIRGFYLNPDRAGPPDATLFDLQMLLSTEAGAAHTRLEVEGWLADSGFEPPRTIELPPPERSALLAARKPA